MKRPAVFFDRDNTLIVGSDFLGDPDDVVLMQGAADAISRARALGYATVVVSNQSGVARGLFTEADVRAVNSKLEDYLREENPSALIDRQEFCPFHPDAVVEKYRRDSDLRKPRPGMLHKAAELLGLDLKRSWMIGDAPRDIEAGQAAGCKTILFQSPGIERSPAADAESTVTADHVCTTLKDAIDYISAHTNDETHNGNKPPSPTQTLALPPVAAEPPKEQIITPDTPPSPVVSANEANPDRPAATVRESQSLHKIERLLEKILEETKRRHESPGDFSVSKLMAGITQILAIAVLFVAYLNRNNAAMFPLIFTSIFCELLTISLLIMDGQR